MTDANKATKALQKASKSGTMLGLKANEVSDILSNYKDQIAQALPKHLTVDRVIQLATTLIARNPAIAECTAESLIGGVMQASILGFPPVEHLGYCYFVPYNNNKSGKKEVQFQIGYKGYLDLARRSGEIKSIHAYEVYENDEFNYELGLEPKIEHRPAAGDRGKIKYAYAVAHFKNGGQAFDIIDQHEINKRKAQSQSAKSQYSPWSKWESAMWVKTAIKKLAKFLPLSTDIVNDMLTDSAVIKPESFQEGGHIDPNKIDPEKYENVIDAEDLEAQKQNLEKVQSLLKKVKTKEDYDKCKEEVEDLMKKLSQDDVQTVTDQIFDLLSSFEVQEKPEKKPAAK